MSRSMKTKTNRHAVGHRSCAWLTTMDDAALTLLSTGETITISAINAHMGNLAPRILRSMVRLCRRGVAVFTNGGYQLAAE